MATSKITDVSRPRLVDKTGARSEVWANFAYIADEEGNQTNTTNPVYKRCYKSIQCRGGNTSNLATHLADKHPDLYKELRSRQGYLRSLPPPPQPPPAAPPRSYLQNQT